MASPTHLIDSALGWRSRRLWVVVIVTAIVATHDLAGVYLHSQRAPLPWHLMATLFTFSCALVYGLHMLKSHNELQTKLSIRIAERDNMQQAMERSILQLKNTVAEGEFRNQQLTCLAQFAELAHACNTEPEVLNCVQEYLPQIFPATEGALYLSTDNERWPRALAWPPSARFLPALSSGRCELLKQHSGNHRHSSECIACCDGTFRDDIPPCDCLRLALDGVLLGTLHVRAPATAVGEDRMRSPFDRSLILLLRNQIALALANVRSRQSLGEMVIRDPLTGAFNRRYLEETLAREIEKSKRDRTPLAVLMLDLDHFKAVNDTYGHPTGDLLLRQFARMLMGEVRAGDIVARYGGEEFVVVLENASALVARGRADQLRRSVHRLSSVVHHQRMISASIGVAVMPDNGSDPRHLIQAADNAVYIAKHAGRDRVVVARPLHSMFATCTEEQSTQTMSL